MGMARTVRVWLGWGKSPPAADGSGQNWLWREDTWQQSRGCRLDNLTEEINGFLAVESTGFDDAVEDAGVRRSCHGVRPAPLAGP